MVVVLNQTGDELDLDEQSRRLSQGAWTTDDSVAPEVIAPGGSAVWLCKSSGASRGIDGSVIYTVRGQAPHDKIRFCWKNRYFGPNFYDATATRKTHVINIHGGSGAKAVVVFVLGMSMHVLSRIPSLTFLQGQLSQGPRAEVTHRETDL